MTSSIEVRPMDVRPRRRAGAPGGARRAARWPALWLAALMLAGAFLPALAQAQEGEETGGPVAILTDVTGVIGPATSHHVETVVSAAVERGARVVILRINTPGGLVTSMREIISTILDSSVPVVGFVAPPGGRAASAGTYIIYATHLAAMAPGTNIGAATPVQMGGTPRLPFGDEEEPASGEEDATPAEEGGEGGSDEPSGRSPASPGEAKAVNDAVALILSLAELRGRNAEWAEKAVREADSISAERAVEIGVVEIMARDVDALLAALDGRGVTIAGEERTLQTRGIPVERVEPSLMTRLLGILANPNVAFLLMLVGAYGLIYEFANPGIGSGIPAVICLVLALYALNQLPLNYAGLALLLLGIAFMTAEAFTPTFGILGIGGLAAFVIGAGMLVDTDIPQYQLSWTLIGTTAAFSGLLLTLLLGYVWRAHRRPVRSGVEIEVGTEAEVLDWEGGEGHVWAHGERWNARGPGTLAAGDRVWIAAFEGLTAEVTAAPPRAGGDAGTSDGDKP